MRKGDLINDAEHLNPPIMQGVLGVEIGRMNAAECLSMSTRQVKRRFRTGRRHVELCLPCIELMLILETCLQTVFVPN